MSDGNTEPTGPGLADRLASMRSDGQDDAERVNRSRGDSGRAMLDGHQSNLFWTFVSAVAGWMLLMLVLLFTIEMWSIELYFIVSFHGLLGARLLFAPTDRVPTWWRLMNWMVYAGFALLGYIIVPHSIEFVV
ncbi:MAG: hypothetical protein V5A15_00300 [Haloarcula sp.]